MTAGDVIVPLAFGGRRLVLEAHDFEFREAFPAQSIHLITCTFWALLGSPYWGDLFDNGDHQDAEADPN